MTTQLRVIEGGALAALETLTDQVTALVETTEQVASGDPILRLLRSGEWVFGAENIPVEDDDLLALNPLSIQHGYISWGEGEILGERMVPMSQPKPQRATLPETGASWDEQFLIEGTFNDDQRTRVIYKPTSLGGRKAFSALMHQIISRSKSGDGKVVPVVQLKNDSYKHPKYGKIFTPVLDVVTWMHIEATEIPEGDEEEPVPEEKPAPAAGPRRRQRTKRK